MKPVQVYNKEGGDVKPNNLGSCCQKVFWFHALKLFYSQSGNITRVLEPNYSHQQFLAPLSKSCPQNHKHEHPNWIQSRSRDPSGPCPRSPNIQWPLRLPRQWILCFWAQPFRNRANSTCRSSLQPQLRGFGPKVGFSTAWSNAGDFSGWNVSGNREQSRKNFGSGQGSADSMRNERYRTKIPWRHHEE